MKLIRTIATGDFQELLAQATNGDTIELCDHCYPTEDFKPHPKGVAIERGCNYLLNGSHVISEEEWNKLPKESPHGDIVRVNGKYLLVVNRP